MPTAGKLCEFVQAAFQKRFIYGEYLQIAELDAMNVSETVAPILRKTYLWDPLEPVATRILAMSVDGVTILEPKDKEIITQETSMNNMYQGLVSIMK